MAAVAGGFPASKDIALSGDQMDNELPAQMPSRHGDDNVDEHEEDALLDDDESLRRWKEQLLGSVDISAVGDSREADVKVLSLSILCRADRYCHANFIWAPVLASKKEAFFV